MIQAVECCTIIALGLAACVVPTLAGLLLVQGLDVDLLATWRVGVDVWLLGHGVDVGVTLPTQLVVATGIESAGRPFVLSIAALGIGLVTVLLAVRSGMRLVAAPSPVAALGGGVIATAAIGALLGLSAQQAAVAPNVVHAAILPAAVMLVGLLVGVAWRGVDVEGLGHDWLALDERVAWLVRASLQSGLGAIAALVGLAGAFLAVLLVARQADVIVLFEAMQPDHLGIVLVWLTQLALLPNAIVWTLAWMLGPGFALGTGTSVGPLGTELGPVPTVPLLGAIDPQPQAWALAIVAVPLLGALAVGALARQRADAEDATWWELLVIAAGGALVTGLGVAALAAISIGGVGPGRLAATGPDALLTGGMAAGVTVVGLALGLWLGGLTGGFTLGRSSLEDDDPIDDLDHEEAADADDRAAHDDEPSDEQDEGDPAEAADDDADDRGDRPTPEDQDQVDTAVVTPLEGSRRRPRVPRRR